MDENLRTSSARAASVIVVFASLLITGSGAFLLFSYPLEVWWAGIILLPLGIFIFFSGLKWFTNMKREQLLSDAEQKTIHQLINKKQTTGPTILTGEATALKYPPGNEALQVHILARWIYTTEQWQQFMKWEKKERKTENIIVMILVLIFGTFLLRAGREAPWWAAVTVSVVIAVLYGVISYAVSLNALRQTTKNAEVIITKDAVMINGHYNRLRGENLWFEGVEMKHHEMFKYLEFTTGHTTRSGNAKNELRIPIPPGREVEANSLVNEFCVNR